MAIRYLVHSEPDIDEVVLAINLGNDRHVILSASPLSFRCPRGTAGHDHLESELCEEPVEEPVELETPSSHAPFYNFPIKIFSAIRTSLSNFRRLPLQVVRHYILLTLFLKSLNLARHFCTFAAAQAKNCR